MIRLPEDSSLRNAHAHPESARRGRLHHAHRSHCRPCSPFWRATTPITTMPSSSMSWRRSTCRSPARSLPDEPKHLVLGTYGEHEDFFKMKGEIEAFLRGMNVPEAAAYTAEKRRPDVTIPAAAPASAMGGVDLGVLRPDAIRSWPSSYGIRRRDFRRRAELHGPVCPCSCRKRPIRRCQSTRPSPATSPSSATRPLTVAALSDMHPRRRRQAAAQRGAVRYLPRQGHRFRLEERGLPPDAPCRRPHADGCRFRRRRVRRSGRSGKRAERQAPLSTVLFPICLRIFPLLYPEFRI